LLKPYDLASDLHGAGGFVYHNVLGAYHAPRDVSLVDPEK
jgi:hypothetical protein